MEFADIFSNQETPINGLYGLNNLGNTCYLNSIIQTLSNIPSFRKFLLDKEFEPLIINKNTCNNVNDVINNVGVGVAVGVAVGNGTHNSQLATAVAVVPETPPILCSNLEFVPSLT